MADLNKLVDELSALTVLEAAQLTKLLEEKWGVSAAAPVGYRARIRNHGHSCFLCEIVIRSQFHTTYEPEA
jgi:LSU ribosomal protein L12P